MPPAQEPSAPPLPFAISRISHKAERYFLHSAPIITWLRSTHHILGVLIGTLAQIPQQNVFLGLPLELQPEEARLLVEKKLAYIVDDLQWHKKCYAEMSKDEKDAYKASLREEGEKLARASVAESRKRSETALRKRREKGQMPGPVSTEDTAVPGAETEGLPEEESLFGAGQSQPPSTTPSQSNSLPTSIAPFSIIPTSSHPLLPTTPYTLNQDPPTVNPASYALFKHLHSNDYFLSPGLRFGCQFLVYPGDPLRFHSHFLAMSAEWEEEIDLRDMVGGGRLGTGVKKSYLIGGPVRKGVHGSKGAAEAQEVRTFCIEWGGM